MTIAQANGEVIRRIQAAKVALTAVARAEEVLPVLQQGYTLTHSGPPIRWQNMRPAMQGAACGAMVYEGWAKTLEEAAEMAAAGKISFVSNNEHHAVGPMAGIISPSMPVWVFRNLTFGNEVYVTLNEGLGKTLRFGANDASVIMRLKWIERVLGPTLAQALEISGEILVSDMLASGIRQGDEGHNRNKASTGLLIRKLAPYIVEGADSREQAAEVLRFLDGNDHTFLNLSMGISKATMEAAEGVAGSTIVTCMCTNGYEFGLRVSGTGTRWFTAPSTYAQGNYFTGYTAADASTTMGDSYVSEAAGIGAFAMAAAPAIGGFIGITAQEAVDYSLKMYEITVAEHETYQLPVLNFRGAPLGIDVRKVIATGSLPVINTGIAHKDAGVGQIGAGVVYPPMDVFLQAEKVLAE